MIEDISNNGRRPVAYLNETFLESPDARGLRILSEYLEPLSHFRDEKIQDTIVFFGSARISEEGPLGRYYRDARTLARLITEWSSKLDSTSHRFVVCSGGGPGIMEAANRGAADAGGKTIGLEHRPAVRADGRTLSSRRSCPSSSTTSSCASSGLRIWPRRW